MWSISVAIFALGFATVSQGKAFSKNCDEISINNYTQEVLAEFNDTSVFQIAVSKKTRNIYIAVVYKVASWERRLFVLRKEEDTPSKINTGETFYITALSTISASEGKVYIGSNTGLKVYDELIGTIEDISEITQSIWKIFVLKGQSELYVSVWPDGRILKYSYPTFREEDLHIEVPKEQRGLFIVDFEGNYYYHNNETKTQMLSQENLQPIIYEGDIIDNLALDNFGRVYGTVNRRLYRLKSNSSIPEFVSLLDFDAQCMLFDENNNMIFGTKDGKVVVLTYDSESPRPNDSVLMESLNKMTAKYADLSNRTDKLEKELLEQNLELKNIEMSLENKKGITIHLNIGQYIHAPLLNRMD